MENFNRICFAICCIVLVASPIKSSAKFTYWQQHIAYNIHVSLDDKHHIIRAYETVRYTNNSPAILNEIYFHLWPNAYKNNRTPFARQRLAEGQKDFHDAYDSDRGFIDSLNFKVDGQEVKIEYIDKSHEIVKLILKTPLATGQTITITTPFRVKIPKTFSRMGHSSQAYYISQWYPKPAVYDRNGWNTFPYLDQGEFYSEYGSFDVSITLPENYIVAATGRLMTETEKNFLDKIAIKSDDTSKSLTNTINQFIKKPKANNDFPPSSQNLKTIRYVQDSIHDFAWFADKRYIVEKTDTILPSGKKVVCWSMYTPQMQKDWKGSAKTVAQTIGFYSEQVGEYPYVSATAVSGDLMPTAGGMEYPMVTVISTKGGLSQVIVHEVGHNWFYGILGSQERQHPWMDEGINSFYDALFFNKSLTLESYFKKSLKGISLTDLNEANTNTMAYIYEARSGLDQPIDLPAADFTSINYGTIVYGKTPTILRYLYFYLGKDEFKRIMHIYFNTWKFKHPLPEDIEEIFETNTSKDISSFFGDFLKTDKRLDYAISKVRKDGGNYIITVKNKGQVVAPVFAAICNKDTVFNDTTIYNPAKKYEITLPANPNAGYAMINPFVLTPDVYYANNLYNLSRGGRFKPLHFQGIAGIERPDKTNVLWSPVVGWNEEDKWMLGIGFSSDLLPPKRFSYQLMPMYAFGSQILTGLGRISYNFTPYSSLLKNYIEIGINGKQFSFDQAISGYFTKVQPYITWDFQKKPTGPSMKHEITLSSNYIMNHLGKTDPGFPVSDFPSTLMVNDLKYSMHNGPFIHSFYTGATFENIQGYTNRLTAEMILRRPSPIRNQQIYFRLFAGTLVGGTPSNAIYYLPLGGIGGYQDFAYNNLYFDRAGKTSVFGQQIEPGAGGFKFVSNTAAFSTNKWVATSSIAANIPKLPIRVYVDGGAYQAPDNSIKVEYSAGLSLSVLRENLEIYFPLLNSPDIQNFYGGHSYGKQITFRINIKALDPGKIVKYLIEG